MIGKKLFAYVAPASVTDTTAAVLWNKPEWSEEVNSYLVELNGVAEAVCTCTDCTLDNLQPGTSYKVTVRAIFKDLSVGEPSETLTIITKEAPEVFDIREYGAVADGCTVNTKAIQEAIDACTFNGTVYVPQGIFVTGALFLKSNMTLYMERGAKLLGSTDVKDYPIFRYRHEGKEELCYASLINTPMGDGPNENITLKGYGTIDASGTILKEKEMSLDEAKRGRAVCLRNVDGLYLKDLTIRHSPMWCTHIIYCRNVSLNGVTICSMYDELGVYYHHMENGDGLDIDSCCDFNVFHCTIASQDDCIAVKAGTDEDGRKVGIPSERIRVTNCRMLSGVGVTFGSEMSGGIRDVLVQDCTYEDTYGIAEIKTMRGRGGVIERVTFDNCVLFSRHCPYKDCRWFRGAICIDAFYAKAQFDVNEAEPIDEGTPTIRDIIFKNIVLDTVGGNAVYLSGLPESSLENIYLENVVALGNNGMVTHHINKLSMKDVKIFARAADKSCGEL